MMQQKVKTTRAPRLRLDKNRRLTPMQIYCWATVACLAMLLLALLASRGTLLHRFFFYDVTDTGMDFSIVLSICVGVCPTDSSIRCTRRLQICFSMCCICLCQRHNQLRGRNRISRLST